MPYPKGLPNETFRDGCSETLQVKCAEAKLTGQCNESMLHQTE